MEKKKFIKPSIRILEMDGETILAGSSLNANAEGLSTGLQLNGTTEDGFTSLD